MNKKIIEFTLELIKPYKGRVAIILFSMILISISGMLYPLLQQQMFDSGILVGDLGIVVRYTIIILIIFIVEQIFTFIQFIHYEYINRRIPYQLLDRAVDHSVNLKISYHKDNNFVQTINEVYMDISNITQIVNAHLLQAIVSLFKIIGGMIGLLLIDWRLTVFVLITIPIDVFIKRIIARKRVLHMEKWMDYSAKFSVWFSETFKSIEVIKLWNLQKRRKAEFENLQSDIMREESKMDYVDQYTDSSSKILSGVFSHILNLLGAMLIFGDQLTIGGLFAFAAYSMYVMQPVALLTDISYRLSSSAPAFQRFMDYFENDVENFDGERLPQHNFEVEQLAFKQIEFGYDQNESILKSLDFVINKGERVAFVGANGSGKSSIINLLLRFTDPRSGIITLNNMDIQSISLEDYRELFSVMNQSVSLFDNSIRHNVNILDNLSEDEILDSLKVACAFDFVDSLPEGINTFVGFNGSKLSGGERQKVSLARTLAKAGKILILDEATSNFDVESEKMFNKYITQKNLYDMTIVVSHREHILSHMDKIFVVEDGKIVDVGTFSELGVKNEKFNQLLTQRENNIKAEDEVFSESGFTGGFIQGNFSQTFITEEVTTDEHSN